ncbi:hypothetical protein LOTGIDRAFT_162054 [Lottia gigantea]|uniref:Peptidase M12B domain-containing protein n=1 Tax=Lottia gigantea TaxID=225164 RepID=V4AI02_LOTGI|nr:hypothetical protein LOTGIDRAFT_162054 [Lottia gigantea]ESO93031.1 hypothetical protein LOTGIDRAFT_162054 [Lottia gigantea]
MKTVVNRRSRRYKRASKSYAVELLAVTDYTIKQRFLSRNGGSEDLANSEIKTYYAFLIMGMSERYATITNYYPDVDFSIKGAGIVISNSADDAEYHQRSNKNGILQYITALSEFTEWVYENSKNGELPTHDHAMWFTDDSLAVGKSTDVIGVAWVGTMCTKNSTSIVEEYFTGRTDQIAAHELGHSLNAVHDGDVRGCSNDDSYVMAASSYFPDDKKKSNPWIFSECSALYISYYAPEFKCLSSLSATSSLSTSVLPGQYLDADEQCRIFYGNTKSYFCRNEQLEGFGFDLMCQRMYCYDPSSSSCQTVIAKDFTSCGSEMWCFQGACVTSASAPVTLANCPQGDNKAMGCYSSACGLYDARKLVDCCQSCVGYVPVVQTKNNDKAKRGGGAVGAGAIQGPGIENENGNTICETWDLTCIYCKSNQKYMETQQCVKYRSI